LTEEERIDLGWDVGWIYFVQCGNAGSIKIGWARDPERRIAQLQTAQPSPLKMIGVLPGTQKAEREVQAMFAHGRMRGEWFKRSAVLEGVTRLLLEKGFPVRHAPKSRTITGQNARVKFNLVIPEA
jgi:hypothetical protein